VLIQKLFNKQNSWRWQTLPPPHDNAARRAKQSKHLLQLQTSRYRSGRA